MFLQLWTASCIGALVGTIVPAVAADNINHRVRVDIGVYPWSSVGKIYNSSGAGCTGSVVGPGKVLTAAHCIFNARTRHFIRPELIHFLLGYEGGRYRSHFIVAHYEIGPGYDPAAVTKAQASDWAVLTISASENDNIQPIYLANDLALENADIMLPGFAQDHAFAMTADTNCHLVGYSGSLMVSDCVALPGDLGAPIIAADGAGKFHVVGVQTGTVRIEGISKTIAIASTSPGLRDAVDRR